MCKSFVTATNVPETPSLQLRLLATLALLTLAQSAFAQQPGAPPSLDLPTSKRLLLPAPGGPQALNSLPLSLAVSPDGRWVVSLNAGYGTVESRYAQSLAVLDTATGKVHDYPDHRLGVRAPQTFFSGLAFSPDGTHVYASVGSTTSPTGGPNGRTGNGVAVYAFHDGALTPGAFLKLPLVALAPGRHTDDHPQDGGHLAVPFPAGIAVVPGARERLLVTENLADAAVLIDAATGAVERSFDLSSADAVPSTYPDDVVVTRDGTRGFVSLWNSSQVVELDLLTGKVGQRVDLLRPASPTAAGTHPCALLLDEQDAERTATLYVALANRDAVAAIAIGRPHAPQLAVRGYFDTRLPGQNYFGAQPNALALNADGSRLYVANMATDSVAVIDPRRIRSMKKARGMVEPLGFVPTELMPISLAATGGKLYVATDKGKGTGPNNMPQRPVPGDPGAVYGKLGFTYAPTLLYGSLATLDLAALDRDLAPSTAVVLTSNRMKTEAEDLHFAAAGGKSPIKHILYIIRENRTYDQILGDLSVDGKPVGNGDPSLTMYGQAVTPNAHKLALQFGVLDNFYDSAEVSGDGHVWSNAAIGTDYLERTWQQNYRSGQRSYDYEGMVAEGYPILQRIPDVEEPGTGYIWGDMAAHGRSVYNFGEYVSSVFCGDKHTPVTVDPKAGPMTAGQRPCASNAVAPGQPLPPDWGTGTNLWPWPIPRLAKNIPTKPELVGHFAADFPDFNLRVPDQIRAEVFLHHLAAWQRDRAAGHDSMPRFIDMHLGNDHTAGTTLGGPTPASSVADNDLALGRIVDAISHSPYWDDTAIFVLEDDAQNGADHVDAHRSPVLIVSKYSPHPAPGKPAFIDSRFYTTVSVLRTMEALEGVPPMNNNDALASLIGTLFTGSGDQPAFTADASNRANGLIYAANKRGAPGAAESQKMDFTHPDRADSSKLNVILWRDARGAQPAPALLTQKHPKKKDDDD